MTTPTELKFAQIQLPTEAQAIRFWPTEFIDRDPNHPGLRGCFKDAQFNEDAGSRAWESQSIFVWRPADAEAERAAIAALLAAISAIDAATYECERAGLGLPVKRRLLDARRAVELAIADAA